MTGAVLGLTQREMHEIVTAQRRVDDWLARFTYRPGWRFFTDISTYGDLRLHLRYKAPDTWSSITPDPDDPWAAPYPEIQLGMSERLSHMMVLDLGEPYITKAVYGVIRQMEDHERLEWFKVDGKHRWPPHTPDGGTNYRPT